MGISIYYTKCHSEFTKNLQAPVLQCIEILRKLRMTKPEVLEVLNYIKSVLLDTGWSRMTSSTTSFYESTGGAL